MAFFSSLLATPRKASGKTLLERLGGATQLDDRRDALASFKELSAEEPLRLIVEGGIGLIVRLAGDEDAQLARDALETLSNLCDVGVPAEVPEDRPNANRVAGEHNCDMLLSDAELLPAALAPLERSDFYVRFHGLALLRQLLATRADKTHEALLHAPAAAGRVLALLEDERDIVRNEALHLMRDVVPAAPPELANILAFQGGFESLLTIAEGIVREEGSETADAGAGAVFADTFDALGALLARHVANRRLFVEGGALGRVLSLLALPPSHTSGQAARIRLACRTLWQLLRPPAGAAGGEAGGEGGGEGLADRI
mmetsp:Transcript_47107/g.156145  ORF Transcript_47107/g.156145 Transcript_47107/m.156145 type:complete len:314 (+) Transcript_47107:20-961(+)